MADWGGAQWVLATLMMINVGLPASLRASGLSKGKSAWEWFTEAFFPKALNTVSLALILWWGGFW